MSPLGSAALVLVVSLVALWLLSLRLRNVAIIDLFWGFGFVLCAWVYHSHHPVLDLRQGCQLALVTLWGLRLSLYLTWRNHGKGEDRRYAAMRQAVGPSFQYRSLITVFGLQGGLILLISAPLLLVQTANPSAWAWSDTLAIVAWLIGFFFEAVGDWQLARFKADPANRGRVLDRGVWALTRHPNYFGDAMIWCGLFLFAIALPGGWRTVFAPVVMTFFLLRVSGVALLEKDIAERRPEYRAYIESTSAFIPWFPRRRDSRQT
ncbi:MAG: DUF1295 domain-containing protein [Acidobacteriota bacterium]